MKENTPTDKSVSATTSGNAQPQGTSPATPHRTGIGAAIAGNLCILAATIFWGVNVSFTKALIPDWMTAEGIIVVRLVGGCVLMWLASLFLKDKPIARHDWLNLILGGAVGLFAFIYLFVTSLRYGNPIDISIIMGQAEIAVHLLNFGIRSVKNSGV